MLPHPSSRSASRSAPGANGPPPLPLPLPDLALLLEQHVVAGFPPDLALDLVLNELVARAADATHATAAALALLRGKQMVCRAATGLHAPDLGMPLDTRGGLSGACVRSRLPQLSADTECDPRIDPVITRRLGIRSMLVVPVFEHKKTPADSNPPLTGVLEVFSPLPDAFTDQAKILLADFADECARIHSMATTLKSRPPAEIAHDDDLILSDAEPANSSAATVPELAGDDAGTRDPERNKAESVEALNPSIQAAVQSATDIRPLLLDEELATHVSEPEILPASDLEADSHSRLPLPLAREPYKIWTLVLGGLVILAAAAFSFLIGSRIGWLRPVTSPSTATSQSASKSGAVPPADPSPAARATAKSSARNSEKASASSQQDSSKLKPHAPSPGASDELVVYDNGKVVFRMKPTPVSAGKTASPDSAEGSAQSTSSPTVVARNGVAPKNGSAPKNGLAPSAASQTVWLAPAQAESRLVTRTEPQYPADALAAQRSGDVTLEVHVAEDGTVSFVRTLAGDPQLAAAAAQAVRNWRYQPYRANNQPSPFQTDVTLTFSHPN